MCVCPSTRHGLCSVFGQSPGGLRNARSRCVCQRWPQCVDGGSVVNGTNGRRHAEPVFQPSPDERQTSREKHEYFYFFGVKRWSYGAAVRRFLGWPKSVFGVFGIFGISTWQWDCCFVNFTTNKRHNGGLILVLGVDAGLWFLASCPESQLDPCSRAFSTMIAACNQLKVQRKTHHNSIQYKHNLWKKKKKKTFCNAHFVFSNVCFPEPYAETEAGDGGGWGKKKRRKPIPVPAGEMIDMGAFLVMYKNVALIVARWCGRACRKMPRPPQVPRFPRRRPMCLPPNTHHLPTNPQCSVWCTSPPSPPALALAHTRTCEHIHTHADMCWNSIRCLITS